MAEFEVKIRGVVEETYYVEAESIEEARETWHHADMSHMEFLYETEWPRISELKR